jgi:excisionase family DNA binding protein
MLRTDSLNHMLTLREVAEMLHVHPNTLRRWSDDGKIAAWRITPRGDRRFAEDDVRRFLAEINSANRSRLPRNGQ